MGFTLIFIGTSLVLVLVSLVLLPKRRETLRTFYSNNWFKNSRVLSLSWTHTHTCATRRRGYETGVLGARAVRVD